MQASDSQSVRQVLERAMLELRRLRQENAALKANDKPSAAAKT